MSGLGGSLARGTVLVEGAVSDMEGLNNKRSIRLVRYPGRVVPELPSLCRDRFSQHLWAGRDIWERDGAQEVPGSRQFKVCCGCCGWLATASNIASGATL